MQISNLEKLALASNYYKIIPKQFDPLYHSIKEKGEKLGLPIQFVEVTSDFGLQKSKIEKRYGIEIVVASTVEAIDASLYDKMAAVVSSEKKNHSLRVSLGYGLRTINPSLISGTESGSIVLGSCCRTNNQIMFDIMAHRFLGKEALRYRFCHEMLHEFGYNEQEVSMLQEAYYTCTKDVPNPTIDSLWNKLERAELELKHSIDALFERSSVQAHFLEEAMFALQQNGIDFKCSKMTIRLPKPFSRQWVRVPLLGTSSDYVMSVIENVVREKLSQ